MVALKSEKPSSSWDLAGESGFSFLAKLRPTTRHANTLFFSHAKENSSAHPNK